MNLEKMFSENTTLGERIRAIRQDKSMSGQQLAALVGCSRSHISGIEKNQKNPSPAMLEMLATALSTTVGFLLHGEHADRLAVKKLITLVEQHGDREDLNTLNVIMDNLHFGLTFVLQQQLRAKESVLKSYEVYAKNGKVPETTKKALEDVQREIDRTTLYTRAISQQIRDKP